MVAQADGSRSGGAGDPIGPPRGSGGGGGNGGGFAALTLHDFLSAVGAKTPAPGGGAVASATGALAASLARMVVAYSLGKKSLAEHQDRLAHAAAALDRTAALLMRLADEDAAAYGLVNELSRLPETDERRLREWPTAAAAAVAAPHAAFAACCDLLRLIEELRPITNPQLRSDLAIAAVLADAGARSAAWNVEINFPLLDGDSERARLKHDLATGLSEADKRCARVEQACRG